MANQLVGKTLSQLPVLSTIDGELWLEIIQRPGDTGPFNNYRIPFSAFAGLAGEDGQDGVNGKSAYEIAVDHGYEGTEEQWLETMQGGDTEPLTVEQLQALTATGRFAVKDLLRVTGAQGALAARSGWLNFLFLFDPAISTEINPVGDRLPAQRVLEQGRVEAAGFSYWKNARGPHTEPGATDAIGAEMRLYDNGTLQIGSLEDYIELGEGALITVVDADGSKTFDLNNLDNGPSGCVYITDVNATDPSDNVGNKVKVSDNHTLVTCSSSTTQVDVTVEAIAGPSSFKPSVRLNDAIDIDMLRVGTDGVLFRGTVSVDLAEFGVPPYTLTAVHGDGGEAQATVGMETAPLVTAANFTGGYPGTQTEVKAGDLLACTFTTDVPVVAYEIAGDDAVVTKADTVTPGVAHTVTGLVVANRGVTTRELGFKIRVQKASGTWSEWYDTTQAPTQVDGVTYVKLNNTQPSITFGTVDYPAGKGALDTGDSAVVNHTVANADVFSYTSNGQLSVTTADVFQAAKTVTYVTGTYNVSINNLTLTAVRSANGASVTRATVVKISTALPTVAITLPAARLRSGGNHGTQVQNHTVTLTSTQELREAPSLNAPEGAWVGDWEANANRTVWTRQLAVHDDNTKGSFTFNSLAATSLTGKTQSAINSGATYVLGGFVFRTMTVAAFPNRQVAIGTMVTQPAKLRCSNLSKGSSGSLNFTYQASQTAAADRYTILDDTVWYNCDDANASSNTSGIMQIQLEEVV